MKFTVYHPIKHVLSQFLFYLFGGTKGKILTGNSGIGKSMNLSLIVMLTDPICRLISRGKYRINKKLIDE